MSLLLGCAACGTKGTSATDTGEGGAGGAPTVTITEGKFLIDAGDGGAADAPDSAKTLPCKADFEVLASAPLDSSLPGARSAKVVLDQDDDDAIYFQNSTRFPIHYDFVSTHLSGGDLPLVADLSTFEATEYYRPDRRFILGAVTCD